MSDRYRLQRFLDAQARDYAAALGELRAGHKTTHWIWYILPQLQGLGRSTRAAFYGISNLDEARAYIAHPVLGTRLAECVVAMNAHDGMTAVEILGSIDAQKFRSCLTLFLAVDPANAGFREALEKYFAGTPDQTTLDLLRSA